MGWLGWLGLSVWFGLVWFLVWCGLGFQPAPPPTKKESKTLYPKHTSLNPKPYILHPFFSNLEEQGKGEGERPETPLAGWLLGWLVGWLLGWLAAWLFGWPVGWLAPTQTPNPQP